MAALTKLAAMAVIALAAVVILMIAFAWLGSPETGAASPASATLFDEALVQEIYRRVSPVVVVVRADRWSGNLYEPLNSGSGFLIDGEGHIATNSHVIKGADRVHISFLHGVTAPAEIVGVSPGNDLALLKVSSAHVKSIEPVEIGDSSLVTPGQLAVAIGSPFGLGGSVTVGVVGGIERVLGNDSARPVHGILQTDAVINPGDSGGPLLDRTGRVVGINTAVKRSPDQSNADNAGRRIGFALPVNTLTRLLPKLKEGQVMAPNFLGIAIQTINTSSLAQPDLPFSGGVYVTRVLAQSPAHRAGLVPWIGHPQFMGDIILAVDGAVVNSVSGFFTELDRHQPGEQVALTVARGRKTREVMVTLDWWPTGSNPFVGSPNVPFPLTHRSRAPYYPFIPHTPGFPFPELFPSNFLE